MSHQKSSHSGYQSNPMNNNTKNYKKSFHTSLNPSALTKYFGLVKNFSPIQKNLNNKLSLKKKPQESNNNTINNKHNSFNNNKKNVQANNYFQTSSQFLKYKTLKPYLNKTSNSKTFKSINTNNYIINTLNLSEKKIINTSIDPQNETVDFDKNYKKLRKEKEELEKKISDQKKLIVKLIEDNEKVDSKLNELYEDNSKMRNKLNSYKDTQEQLIMLIKLIQKNGIDVEGIIDKWNNEVEKEEEKENEIKQLNSSFDNKDENKYYDNKLDNSFTPIILDENPQKENHKISGVPKLNFDNLHKKIANNERNKYNNHKKNKSFEHNNNNNSEEINNDIEKINKKIENINKKN